MGVSEGAPPGVNARRSRGLALVALGLTIALGLGSRRLHLGIHLWDKSLGDALYTVMVYELAFLARPRAAPVRLGVIAFAISFAIELFQLTGIPEDAPRLLQLVLGTTFAWHDVLCYAVGAALVGGGHHLVRKLGHPRKIV